MGYFTNFELNIYGVKDHGVINTTDFTISEEVYDELLLEIEKMNLFSDGDLEDGWWVEATWYDWEKDMCLFSSKFPDILFCLNGEGENFDDIWKAYFLNGETQFCPGVITYDEFDIDNLQTINSTPTSSLKYSYQL